MKKFFYIINLICILILFSSCTTPTEQLATEENSMSYSSEYYSLFDFSDIYTPIYSSVYSYTPEKESDSASKENNSSELHYDENIVFITDTGEKYHRATCGSLWNSSHNTTPNEAWKQGYSPCSKCNPPLPDELEEYFASLQ